MVIFEDSWHCHLSRAFSSGYVFICPISYTCVVVPDMSHEYSCSNQGCFIPMADISLSWPVVKELPRTQISKQMPLFFRILDKNVKNIGVVIRYLPSFMHWLFMTFWSFSAVGPHEPTFVRNTEKRSFAYQGGRYP